MGMLVIQLLIMMAGKTRITIDFGTP